MNVPLVQAAHVRSLATVDALSMNVPAAHGPLTLLHALPSLVLENVVMPSHAPHTRSADAEPGATWPWPAGHKRQAAQAWLPVVALNVPSGQALHTRFHVAPGPSTSYSPAPHDLMSWHTRSA